MPQQSAPPDHEVHDETVRLRPGGVDGRPPPDGSRSTTRVERDDDTRPVTSDRPPGAPDVGVPAASDLLPRGVDQEDDRTTQALDTAGALFAPGATDTAPVGTPPLDPAPVGTAAATKGDAAAATEGGAASLRSEGGAAGDEVTSGDPPGPDGSRGRRWRRRAALVPAGVVAVLAALYGADTLISAGQVPRSTVVAGVDIGGLSPAAAARTLQEQLAPRVAADRTLVADDVEAALSPVTAGLTLDVAATVDAVDDQPRNPLTRLVTLFSDREVDPVISADRLSLTAQIETVAASVDRAPVDATVAIDGTTPRVVEASDGRNLDREGSADAIIAALTSGQDPATAIELPVEFTPVRVDRAEAQRVLEETVTPALSAPVSVVVPGSDATAAVSAQAIATALTFTAQDDGVLAVGIDPAALGTALGDELAVFGRGAQDARFEVSGGTVTVAPSVDGTGVSPATLAQRLLPVLTEPEPRTVTAQLGPVPAEFTTEEARSLGIKEEIGSFTTKIGNPASGENIRVVAAKVDGAVVLPGETFSLNTFTGPRGTAQGYVPAGVISGGQFTQAVGGGISQFATTMFNAMFFAGLEDVYHKPHSYYISRYPAGREATVYEGQIDLQWRNDTDTGVYIDTAWTPGTITVTFYGTKRYEIQSISSDRTDVREPVVQEKPDDGTCTAQAGAQGFNITVTRVFRDRATGAEIRREDFRTHYAAEPIIRCIPPPAQAQAQAPAPAPASPPAPASTPGG